MPNEDSHEKMKLCPITREQFRTNAPSGREVFAKVVEKIELKAKEFTSGGFGYFGVGKIVLVLGGQEVTCHVSITASVVNSRNASE